MTDPTPAPRQRAAGSRFAPFALIAFLVVLLFIGGTAATLYLIFSEYSGVRNVWILACGAPVAVVIVGFLIVFNLYTRFGRPLRQILDAIDAVAEGDRSVRVPPDDSPQFGELIKRFNAMVGELERAEQQRRNLTADIAHELRTPLHLIQGNLEGLLDGVYPPTPEHLNATLDETRLLTRLVNDMQTLSLAETGQLPLHPTRFALADLLQDLTTSFAAQAAAGGVALTTHLVDAGQEITADYDRLNQVMSNLIANALRYTPPGGAISVSAGPGTSEGRSASLVVSDTGSGIAAEDLAFIFDRFWRADRSRGERTHSGLGLAITRQWVHAHGGTIDVRSTVGSGTTFSLELP